MTLQEIFTKVKAHLLTQNTQSVDSGSNCCYRGPDGLMCAVGCLIPDALYSPSLESRVATSAALQPALRAAGLLDEPGALHLLSDLQAVHDKSPASFWPDELAQVAAAHRLEDV